MSLSRVDLSPVVTGIMEGERLFIPITLYNQTLVPNTHRWTYYVVLHCIDEIKGTLWEGLGKVGNLGRCTTLSWFCSFLY